MLGRSVVCSPKRIPLVNRDMIVTYRQRLFTPDRIVIGVAGLEHEMAVQLAEQYFGDMAPSDRPYVAEKARYTGGARHEYVPDAKMLTVSVAFESVHASSPDLFAVAALQTLMGGGGSFSSGGPGKGMYTRLYTEILNQYNWMEHTSANIACYADSGLFSITFSAPPTYLSATLNLLGEQFLGMAAGIDERELSRAKNQLKSNMLMAIETRATLLEEATRQVMLMGKSVSVQDVCDAIDALKADDLQRVAFDMLFTARMQLRPLSVAVYGPTGAGLPPSEAVADTLRTHLAAGR